MLKRKIILAGGLFILVGFSIGANNYVQMSGPHSCQALSNSYILSLQSGWNLIGTSINITRQELLYHFTGINYIWIYNDYVNGTQRRYNNTNNTWIFWSPVPAINNYVKTNLHYPILTEIIGNNTTSTAIPAFTGLYLNR